MQHWLMTLFLLSAWANAQTDNLRFRHYSIEEGLSQAAVYCVTQDKQGYLWIGTQDGLNRFDGYRFNVFRHDAKDPGSLSDNFVTSLMVDASGMLWVGTQAGLNRYNPATRTFQRFLPGEPDSITGTRIWSLHEDRAGMIWIGTEGGGLNRYNPTTNQFQAYGTHPDRAGNLMKNRIYKIVEDSDEDSPYLWLATSESGLYRFDRNTSLFEIIRHDPNRSDSLSDNRVQAVLESWDGALWVGTAAGLDRYNPSTGGFTHYRHNPNNSSSLGPGKVMTLLEDRSGELWVGTAGGLNRFQRENGAFKRYTHDPTDRGSLSQNFIWSAFEDLGGVLWFGVWGGGLNSVDRASARFSHFNRDPKKPDGMSANGIMEVVKTSDGMIWLGTFRGGLDRFDRNTGHFDHFRSESANPTSISNNVVWAVHEDRTQPVLWVGTNGGLNQTALNGPDLGKFKVYQHDPEDPNSLGHHSVWTMDQDKTGALWVGVNTGLNRFRPETQDFEILTHNPDDPNSISGNRIMVINQEADGRLWVGTFHGGLNLFDPQQRTFRHYRHRPDDPTSLIHDAVLSLYEDTRDRSLWVGTKNGLSRLERDTNRFQSWTDVDGLANNFVVGVQGDELGRIWISTNKGLSLFDPQTNSFRNYDGRDGLQSDEFNHGASFRAEDGEMLFGGINGFNAFYPVKIKDNPYVPPVVLTDFFLLNERVAPEKDSEVLPLAIEKTKLITLNHEQNVFSFEFASLHFAAPQKNQYAYQLEGFDKSWNHIDASKRYATYTNLDPGKYHFRVKGANKDGVWNETGAGVEIEVLPAPWLTWPAKLVYLLIPLSLLWFYARLQSQKLANEREIARHAGEVAEKDRKIAEQERTNAARLLEIDHLKDEFLANTSHELRTPLNGIIGLAESLKDGATGDLSEGTVQNLDMIIACGKRLSGLVNDILDFSKLKNNTLDLRRGAVDLHALTELVITLSRPLVGDKDLVLINEIAPETPLVAGDENRIQQIMHNLVSNGIKFSESGSVEVTAQTRTSQVYISVTDTGIGIAGDQMDRIFESFEQLDGSDNRRFGGAGLGLAVTRQLVELHGGRITVSSKPGKGAVFCFSIPIYRKGFVSPDHSPRDSALLPAATIADPPKQPVQADPVDQESTNAPHRLLVVDDEPVNRRVLANYLNHCQVTEADGGQEALAAIESGQRFDLVLLDVMMPGMSGYDVCKRIREKHPLHDLPVIFLSAKTQESDLENGFDVGGSDFLAKPISKSELMARVSIHLHLLDVRRGLSSEIRKRGAELLQKESLVAEIAQQSARKEAVLSHSLVGLGLLHELERVLAELNDYAALTRPSTDDGDAAPQLEPADQKRTHGLFTQNLSRLDRCLQIANPGGVIDGDGKSFVVGLETLFEMALSGSLALYQIANIGSRFEADPQVEALASAPEPPKALLGRMIKNSVAALRRAQRLDPAHQPQIFLSLEMEAGKVQVHLRDNGKYDQNDTDFPSFYTTRPAHWVNMEADVSSTSPEVEVRRMGSADGSNLETFNHFVIEP